MTSINEAPLPWTEQNVLALLDLEPAGGDVFISRYNQINLNGHLFGGQVLGQAAAAAAATVTGLTMHSLHAYFLRAGTVGARVAFAVERARDGRRFATRRVIATQNGKTIFVLSCSFFHPQPGFEHQTAAPAAPPPEELESLADIARASGVELPTGLTRLSHTYPIEVRPVAGRAVMQRADAPRIRFWVRVPSAASTDNPQAHQQVLAYLSDYFLIAAALAPHRSVFLDEHFEVASLDHAMWFHRPARADEWLLYDTESPNARNGVNLSRGLIYDRQGNLIASTAQEGLQTPRG
ncbi:acyl-CoA thioesterase II [Acidocella aquatica]|uniref:Acyl-CoA thioesterase II n=1 Tax=Acidocella aquatica TaxID=1922313 RepID=A0ABQ6A5S4_9PROT|nr:acyl-CoA thioesterase domain-containing protein [Acidocella aquatica]GLR65450.1 acyl-CoA thioesterase II [Acidocella aquatica]